MGLLKQLGNGLAEGLVAGASAVGSAVVVVVSAVGSVFLATAEILWTYLVLPLGASGLNLVGYAVEKFLFGPPGLRKYADAGIFPANVDYGTRNKIVTQYGFDPYENIHPFFDNIFGAVLGVGLGLFQYLNYATLVIKNFALSTRANLRVTFNFLLGNQGWFGEREDFDDDRPSGLTTLFFGLLSAPLVGVLALSLNALDLLLTTSYHVVLSTLVNSVRTFNLVLGGQGTFGERQTDFSLASDTQRHVALRWLFGLITLPVVVAIAAVTNLIDVTVQVGYHTLYSLSVHVRAAYHLLGDYGSLGKHHGYSDDRTSLVAKLFFGVVSAPIVLAVIGVTNLLDVSMTLFYHTALSIKNNLTPTMNLLGEYGKLGVRTPYFDQRPSRLTRITYGVISFPLVAALAVVTNALDIALTLGLNYSYSVYHLVRRSFNLLGDYGVFGSRCHNTDTRGRAAQWIYGFFALPVVIALDVLPNVIDFAGGFVDNVRLSYRHNMKFLSTLMKGSREVNAPLPEVDELIESVAETKLRFDDPRPWPLVVIFGVLSLPLVVPSVVVTSFIKGGSRFIHHSALSIKHNFLASYNVLGDYGFYGKNTLHPDPRQGLLIRLVYGAITLPMVAVASGITNLVNIPLTLGDQVRLSIQHNIHASYGLLGVHGFVRSTHTVDTMSDEGGVNERHDRRHWLARLVFGLPSLVVVVPVVVVTNTVDAVLTSAYHFGESFRFNLRATYHLLGKHSFIGQRVDGEISQHEAQVNPVPSLPLANQQDRRHFGLRLVFGVLSFPAVMVVSVVTNTLDAVLSVTEQTWWSFARNLRPTYNIVLGAEGVFIDQPYADNRAIGVRLLFGLVSLPLVGVVGALTNLLDLVLTGGYHGLLSLQLNFERYSHLLGSRGVFGPNHEVLDGRGWVVKGLFGLLTAPAVLGAILVSNSLDVVLTLFSHTYNLLTTPKFWKITGGVVGGVALTPVALPLFLARRFLKSLYYLFIKGWTDPDQNSRKYLKSVVNILTLGLSSLAFKYAGYSSRFRPSYMQAGDLEVQAGKELMKQTIYAAKRGELKIDDVNVDKASDARKPLRFLGVKHGSEKILKHLDNRYREFNLARLSESEQFSRCIADYKKPTLRGFFDSQKGEAAIREAKQYYAGQLNGKMVDDLVGTLTPPAIGG